MKQLTAISFRTLLSECQTIRIPEIQRDYAQGRKNEKAQAIRENFISSLLPVLTNDDPSKTISLDFVYGYQREEGVFEPLDGQQRLTTIFILHWLFCPESCDDLKITTPDGDHARFRYATRISSGKFCDALIHYSASKLTALWKQHCKQEELKGKRYTFSSFIKELSWFEWGWRYDPTIVAMLNMMDTVLDILKENNLAPEEIKYDNLDKIVFHRLDLDEFNLGDELYVKMNARGKMLSRFDNLKSTLEEELQRQKEENLATEQIESDWRTCMDANWADYFWQTRDGSKKIEEELNAIEERFHSFLNRIIAFDLSEQLENETIATPSDSNNITVSIEKNRELLREICQSTNDEEINQTVTKYIRAIRLHSKGFGAHIRFDRIIETINLILQKDASDKMCDITSLACPSFKWVPEEDMGSLLSNFITHSFSHERRIEFAAILSFVQNVKKTELGNEQTYYQDFAEWMRFTRNCSLNRNLSQRIDTPEKEKRTRILFANMTKKFNERIEAGEICSMREFIEKLSEEQGANIGIENASITEEKIKATLKTNPDWRFELDKAENNTYLWGQLRAPLDWSKNETGYNLDKFKAYCAKLTQIFPVNDPKLKDDLWKSLICLEDYRFNVSGKQTLITYDDDRDVSWKRYMRDKTNGIYAPILKTFIERWQTDDCKDLDLTSFIDKLICQESPKLTDWRKFLLGIRGLSTDYCGGKGYLVDDNKSSVTGHKWLIPKSQIGESRHAYELFITYLDQNVQPCTEKSFYDSASPEADKKNSIELKRNGQTDSIQAIPNGLYRYNQVDEMTADEIIERLKSANLLLRD